MCGTLSCMVGLPGGVVVKGGGVYGGGVYGGGCLKHGAARCIAQCAAGWTLDGSSGHSVCSLAPKDLCRVWFLILFIED